MTETNDAFAPVPFGTPDAKDGTAVHDRFVQEKANDRVTRILGMTSHINRPIGSRADAPMEEQVAEWERLKAAPHEMLQRANERAMVVGLDRAKLELVEQDAAMTAAKSVMRES
jgi:hypothetical protein